MAAVCTNPHDQPRLASWLTNEEVIGYADRLVGRTVNQDAAK